MLGRFVCVSIDDISRFFETLEQHIEQVLERLLEHKLFVKAMSFTGLQSAFSAGAART